MIATRSSDGRIRPYFLDSPVEDEISDFGPISSIFLFVIGIFLFRLDFAEVRRPPAV